MLTGYKTYICALLVIATAVLSYYGILDGTTTNLLYGILGGAGVAAMRSAISD